ncbi:MAG TPA: protein kinase [Vicinamibacterales bacterium]|nr:protein kinase [Vicinamibacterales bacterium]
MEGRVVSHYRILKRLGAGGMGVVYQAEDSRLKRTVALKFLPPELTRDEAARERFIQEAQAASALDHPNICAIYDVDAVDEQLFIAMAYYEGETLRDRIARGPLSVPEALDFALQIARGLDHAHHAGIVHRDIKPANVIVTRGDLIKIVDFGIAKILDRTGPTRTGLTLGTVVYMAPEQVHGYTVDHRADLWALGVVLYEMLTGRPPFGGDRDVAILHNILHETPPAVSTLRADLSPAIEGILVRALTKDRDGRYQSAHEMIQALTACVPATGTMTTVPQAAATVSGSRRLVTVAAIVALLTAAGTAAWFMRRAANARHAEDLIGQITQMADKDRYSPALAALEEVERLAPGDPRLRDLSARIAETRDIVTDPAGASVFIKPYDQPSQPYRLLGQTPIKGARIAREFFRWKIERDGYAPIEVLGPFNRTFSPLTAAGKFPADTLVIHAGPMNLQLAGFNYLARVPGGAFLIDKFEVTNRRYKAFVDAGGYAKREYWAHTFEHAGRVLTWEQAMAEFRDRTGRPGPATWEVGMYPAGQDDYPVTGVSWYEADAFARFSGRGLPTIYHWVRAAGLNQAAYITPLSNLNGKGPALVGSNPALSPEGAMDTAGNAKEWCANAVAGSQGRYLLGGSWRDPAHMFTFADARAPFDRSEDNGFRLVSYLDTPLSATLTNPIAVTRRDFHAERPVPDQVFAAFRGLFAYDPRPLDATIDARDESAAHWVVEKVSFRAAYGDERVPAYVFLPKHVPPPYQAVLFAPGAAAVTKADSSSVIGSPRGDFRALDYVIQSGRAVIFPIYSGTFERNAGQTTVWPNRTRAYQDWIIRVVNDGRRAMEYLQSRADIRHDAIAFMGVSWGASIAPRLLSLETRFKTAVLLDGGLTQSFDVPPALDSVNYLPRVTLPTLMVNGSGDFIYPVEAGQKPFFDLLGTPRDQKRHVVLVGGHFVVGQQRSQVVKTVLDWLDQRLGPVTAR